MPLQLSATSQPPAAAARPTVAVRGTVSAGQAALELVQVSAGSHTPAEARQTVLLETKVLVGQLGLLPSQTSATSQAPAEARHSAPAIGLWTHCALLLTST